MTSITLPNEWRVRDYQWPLWEYMVKDQGLRAIAVWHRRAGKDATALNITALKMWERPGMYLHMLPNQTQARKVIWDARDYDGKRLIDQAFPPALRDGTPNNTEMKILFRPVGEGRASLWQLAGSDNIDAWMGSNPVGVVMSEFDLTNPHAWDYLRPILSMNGGWALFIFTFRGKRHGYALFQAAQKNPNWFAQKLTIDDTRDEIDRDRTAKGLPSIMEAIEDDRASGMAEELIRQEYWCDADVPMPGAIFAHEYTKCVDDGRIGEEYAPIAGVPVDTAWDLGKGSETKHKTAIWFFQRGASIRIVKYFESWGHSVSWYWDKLKEFQQQFGWEYGQHWGPHDLIVADWSTDRTRLEVAYALGLEFRRVANLSVEDQHNAVRMLFPRFCFYESECRNIGKEGGDGLASISSYQFEEDETKSTPQQKYFKRKPLDNWATDGAAALRYLAVAFSDHIEQVRPVEPRFDMTFDEQMAVMKRKARRYG